MPIATIVITENPVSAGEMYEQTLTRGMFTDPSSTHRDQGGFWQASFSYIPTSREDAIRTLNQGLGRNVVFHNDIGAVSWEGFVNTITMDTGAAKITNSLNDMANKVWTRYTPVGGGAVARGTVIESAISQARFGIKEQPLSGGEISNIIADQLTQSYLNLFYWPRPQLESVKLGGSLLDIPKINISCHGYFRTLDWRVYNQTIILGTQTAAAQLSDIIGAVGQFVNTATYEPNSSIVTREYDADRTPADLCRSIADLGNQAYRIFIVGMEENRHFYYREAAPPVRQD